MAESKTLDHGFGPLYSERSEILILGSFPSVKSREAQFYYGHPQNRFWRILRARFDPETERQLLAGEKILRQQHPECDRHRHSLDSGTNADSEDLLQRQHLLPPVSEVLAKAHGGGMQKARADLPRGPSPSLHQSRQCGLVPPKALRRLEGGTGTSVIAKRHSPDLPESAFCFLSRSSLLTLQGPGSAPGSGT